MADPILETKSLKKYFLAGKAGLLETIFRQRPPVVKAVDDVNVNIDKGEVLALVGESGCGKTTFGRLVATLERPTGGEVIFDGKKVDKHNREAVRKQLQMVFQNPYESLDPRSSVKNIVTEPLMKFGLSKAEKSYQFERVMSSVGLNSNFSNRRPKDLSGGQRQRIAVARAIISSPKLVILDEPTSALDASVQSQVLNLLVGLRNELSFSYLFITHNIAVARYISDRAATMYAGEIVEIGPTKKVLKDPKHPYTQALLKAVPSLQTRKLEPPQGEVPSLLNLPSGCRFHTRCPYVMEKCKTDKPSLKRVEDTDVACWLY
jgi:peptide/nickel transport system ATP-binding protein